MKNLRSLGPFVHYGEENTEKQRKNILWDGGFEYKKEFRDSPMDTICCVKLQ